MEIFRVETTTGVIPAGTAGVGTLTAALNSTLVTLAGTTKANAQIQLETGGDISGTDYAVGDNLWIYVPTLNEVREFKAVVDYTATGAIFYLEQPFSIALAAVAFQIVNANLRMYNVLNIDNATAADLNNVANMLPAGVNVAMTAQDVISPKLLDAITFDANGGSGLRITEQTR
jgi:hypothetical protein